ncbi:MFS transporter [Ammonicoccus fulvus]|uniref:MFS transporter n=1 Tax=Ammonicoccus fulvus TaxID=3138240 RepID=A0ABZ3FJX9_9ACTN
MAAVLILLERGGKALRSPSKSALLARAATKVGRGKGFGVHKALDQLGAFAGPLVVAGVVALTASLWLGFAWLVVPGVIAMVILLVIRRGVPDPGNIGATSVAPPAAPREAASSWWRIALGGGLPGVFFGYAVAAALTTAGLVTFAVLSVHLTRDLGVTVAWVPVIYAGAMLVEAVAALGTGWAYDRVGPKVLVVVPVLVGLVPALAFAGLLAVALVGVGVWALAYGIQDSTIKALVAQLVPSDRLAGAYGIFAAIQGAFAMVGGFVAGYLLDRSIPLLIVVVGVSQAVALVLLVVTLRRVRPAIVAG